MTVKNNEAPIDVALTHYFERRDQGEKIELPALAAKFPECATELEQFFAHEQRLNQRLEEISSQSADSGWLTIRCPNCHQPTQIAADTAFTDLTCKSCGSRFGLVGQEQATTAAGPLLTIGRFELVERLGMGAFGTVWKARDKELDRTVAVKIPRQGGMSREEEEKFFREARAAAQLHHPSIVSVHEVGRDGDSIYIVSDFVRGLTLADWLTGQQPSGREAAELCAKVADALHHAHEKGVVHRDLKPANIMLDGDLSPHIMDFGLARRDVGELTMTLDGHVLGTPAYMSPEQAEGKAHAADRRSDVYSIGVILFQLLTGELPFRGNARMLMHQVINDEPPSPRKLNANINRDLETITLKCLEKDPGMRYQTAQDFAAELRRFLAGEPIHARPITKVERAARWVRRNPVLSAASAFAIVALMAGTIVSSIFAIATRREATRAETALKSESAALANEIQARKDADQQAHLARKRFYASQINLAQQALDSRDPGRALTLLEGLRPKAGEEDLRTFEWRYLWQSCHQGCRFLTGHLDCINSVAYSSDGKYLASGSSDRTIKLWNPETGKLLHTIQLGAGCFKVEFSKDCKLLIGSDGGWVRFWNVPDWSLGRSPIAAGLIGVNDFAFSADERLLAVCGRGPDVATIVDLATGAVIDQRPSSDGGFAKVAFSPDGKWYSACSWLSGCLWQLDGGKVSEHVSKFGPNHSIAFSPDSRELIVGSGYVINCDSGHGAQRLNASSFSNTHYTTYSPDGKRVASARADHSALVWDAKSGKVSSMHAHAGPVRSAAFSADGRGLATAGNDRIIKLWDLTYKELPERSEVPIWHPAMSLAFLRDNARLLAGGSKGVFVLDSRTGEEKFLEPKPASVAITPDGRTIAFKEQTGDSITLWDTATESQKGLLKGAPPNDSDLKFAPNGKYVALAAPELTIWNLDSAEPKTMKQGRASSVAFSPDSRYLAYTGGNGSIVKLDPLTAKALRNFLPSRGVPADSSVFSHDGRTLAVGYLDGLIHLIDAETWEARATLAGHTDNVQDLVFFPDGNTLVSVSNDRSVRFWDVETGQERMTLRWDRGIGAVAISPDENAVAAETIGGAVKVWCATPRGETLEGYRIFDSNPETLDEMAWQMATSPNADERDGKKAVALALEACEQTDYSRAYIVDTLAAAYAELGDFESAVKWKQKALELLPTDAKPTSRKVFEAALEDFKAGRRRAKKSLP